MRIGIKILSFVLATILLTEYYASIAPVIHS